MRLLCIPCRQLEIRATQISLLLPCNTPLDAAIIEHDVKLWKLVRAETVDSGVFQIP